jgi:DNA-binding GntR family transcriptional regulator
MDQHSISRPPDRRHRQRAAIERAVAAGDRDRATALAREHLLDFPDDEAVKDILDRR